MQTSRAVAQIDQVVFGLVDLFQGDGSTRQTGVVVANLALKLLFQNDVVSWPLVSGVGVANASIRSGSVYWHEIANSGGIYSVRFRPNALGYWQANVTYQTQIIGLGFDVLRTEFASGALKVSFEEG